MIYAFKIGEVIRHERINQNLSQETLCEGICSVVTLSRIENGVQNPTKNVADAIIQRLGISEKRYYSLISDSEFNLEEMKYEIRKLIIQKNYVEAFDLLTKLEKSEKDNSIVQQFVLHSKTKIGSFSNGIIIPYSDLQKLKQYTKAIKLTISKYSETNIQNLLLTIQEIRIIINIADCYTSLSEYKKAISIYEQLLNYINMHCINMNEIAGLLAQIYYNYSLSLGYSKQYEKAIHICEKAKRFDIDNEKLSTLGPLMICESECLYYVNKTNEALEILMNAYYLLKATKQYEFQNIAKLNLQQKFKKEIEL